MGDNLGSIDGIGQLLCWAFLPLFRYEGVGEYGSYSGISGITDSFRALSRLGESVEVLTKALQKALET